MLRRRQRPRGPAVPGQGGHELQEFEGRTALVTGAASGIGRALAVALADRGCELLLVDVNDSALRTLRAELAAKGHRVHTRSCDLSCDADVQALAESVVDQRQGVDLLINNAGIAFYGPTDAMTADQWDRLMRVNLLAPVRLTCALLPSLLQRPDPHVVNMCSISGLVAGGRFAAYHTSKFGLIGFTESIRAEYGRRGLGVTAICPGPVTTGLYRSAESGRADRAVPEPPRWLCTTPERVAAVTLRAIQRNRRQVLITPLAHVLYQLKRFTPGLLDFVNQFSRSRRKRRLQREAALRELQHRNVSGETAGTDDESLRNAA